MDRLLFGTTMISKYLYETLIIEHGKFKTFICENDYQCRREIKMYLGNKYAIGVSDLVANKFINKKTLIKNLFDNGKR